MLPSQLRRRALYVAKVLSQSWLKGNFFSTTSCVALAEKKTLAIYREESSMWERRAPLSPVHVRALTQDGVKVLVQPSNRRAYPMHDYEREGAFITEDISEADLVIGVKQPPIHRLIPNKTYMFFSHTIKAQPENMALLDAVLEKGIRLLDYECICADGLRVVAFGKFAGMCGMINILHGLGLRLLALGHHTPFMYVGPAHNYPSTVEAKAAISALGREIGQGSMPESLGPLVFVFTGAGNVSSGAQEVFTELPHEFVSHDDLKKVSECGDTRKVYGTIVDKHHHLIRKDGGKYTDEDFAKKPHDYKATFYEKIMSYATCLVNGVFWNPGSARLITNEQGLSLHPPSFDSANLIHEGMPKLPQRLLAIADISIDLNGSLEFNHQLTTIDHPFILHNLHTGQVSNNLSGNGILVMAIDNLPAQVPRESTQYFGSKLLPLIHDLLQVDGKRSLEEYEIDKTVKDAVITHNGELTERFQYIQKQRSATSRNGDGNGSMSAESYDLSDVTTRNQKRI